MADGLHRPLWQRSLQAGGVRVAGMQAQQASRYHGNNLSQRCATSPPPAAYPPACLPQPGQKKKKKSFCRD